MQPSGIILSLVNHTQKVVCNLQKMKLDQFSIVYKASFLFKKKRATNQQDVLNKFVFILQCFCCKLCLD